MGLGYTLCSDGNNVFYLYGTWRSCLKYLSAVYCSCFPCLASTQVACKNCKIISIDWVFLTTGNNKIAIFEPLMQQKHFKMLLLITICQIFVGNNWVGVAVELMAAWKRFSTAVCLPRCLRWQNSQRRRCYFQWEVSHELVQRPTIETPSAEICHRCSIDPLTSNRLLVHCHMCSFVVLWIGHFPLIVTAQRVRQQHDLLSNWEPRILS